MSCIYLIYNYIIIFHHKPIWCAKSYIGTFTRKLSSYWATHLDSLASRNHKCLWKFVGKMTSDLGLEQRRFTEIALLVRYFGWLAHWWGLILIQIQYGLFRYCMESEMIGIDCLSNVICTLLSIFPANKQASISIWKVSSKSCLHNKRLIDLQPAFCRCPGPRPSHHVPVGIIPYPFETHTSGHLEAWAIRASDRRGVCWMPVQHWRGLVPDFFVSIITTSGNKKVDKQNRWKKHWKKSMTDI